MNNYFKSSSSFNCFWFYSYWEWHGRVQTSNRSVIKPVARYIEFY